jgi:hypothetical protein
MLRYYFNKSPASYIPTAAMPPGELGCGYADGSLTAEETVLAAYWRGRCIKEAKLPPGGMAAVGMYDAGLLLK